MTANYMMITVAACEPSYAQEALEHLGPLVRDLQEKAACVGARYGSVASGTEAGSLVLFQSYAGLSDIEKVFDVYAASSAYQPLVQAHPCAHRARHGHAAPTRLRHGVSTRKALR